MYCIQPLPASQPTAWSVPSDSAAMLMSEKSEKLPLVGFSR